MLVQVLVVTFCLPPDNNRDRRQVTQKGPENDYIPFSDGSLNKLWHYCSLRLSSLKIDSANIGFLFDVYERQCFYPSSKLLHLHTGYQNMNSTKNGISFYQ